MDIREVIKKNRVLILIFIFALIVRIIFVFAVPVRMWDEAVYLNLGHDLSNNPLDYSVANNGWSDFMPPIKEAFYGWPKMGFRAPLLPYMLSFFYLLRLDLIIDFLVPAIGAASVILVYILGKEMFNMKVGVISSLFLSLIPLHVFYSGRVLTGVLFTFFLLLTFISFWKGYEKDDKKYKILFGVFLALALLSRYTALWIMPVFLIYFLIRDKSFKFLKNKYLWQAILMFFLVLIPWFIYGVFEYGNPIGAFIHGAKASAYWGGIQPWNFFFDYWWEIFSVIGDVFVVALIYILYKKEFLKKEVCLLLTWFVVFFGFAIYMPHKETRFILAISPVVALLSGYLVSKIKRYRYLVIIGIILVSLWSLFSFFSMNYANSYTDMNECFLEGNEFLRSQDGILVVTDESAIVYYYTRQSTCFYPSPLSYESLDRLSSVYYPDGNNFVFLVGYNDYDIYEDVREDLDVNNEKVFECAKRDSYSVIYKI